MPACAGAPQLKVTSAAKAAITTNQRMRLFIIGSPKNHHAGSAALFTPEGTDRRLHRFVHLVPAAGQEEGLRPVCCSVPVGAVRTRLARILCPAAGEQNAGRAA